MKRLLFHLWYDNEAREAVQFYSTVFSNCQLRHHYVLEDTPSGQVELIGFTLEDLSLEALNAGPFFQRNPSISLALFCHNEAECTQYLHKLTHKILRPLPVSFTWPNFALVEDRFGLSWVINIYPGEKTPGKIIPCLHFPRDYTQQLLHYRQMFQDDHKELCLDHDSFSMLRIQESPLLLSKGVLESEVPFTPALSFIYLCQNQQEIDSFYHGFSTDTSSEQCGWILDRFGVSWQIVPDFLFDHPLVIDPFTYQKLNQKILSMKRLEYDSLFKLACHSH